MIVIFGSVDYQDNNFSSKIEEHFSKSKTNMVTIFIPEKDFF